MKRIVPVVVSFFVITAITGFHSCKKNDEGDSCARLASEFTAASNAYLNDITNSSKCQAFKTAALNYLNGCGDLDPATRQQIKDQYESLSCK
jgi:hypothetical protein